MLIKKVFIAVIIAAVFGLLVLGAINRTIAKTAENRPNALSETKTELKGGYGNQGHTPVLHGHNEDQGGLEWGSFTSDGRKQEITAKKNISKTIVNDWFTVSGSVGTITADLWTINLIGNGSLSIEGQTLSYLQENGFLVTVDDELLITDFMEGERFEIGKIDNNSTRGSIEVRKKTGRPLWAGGRWGGNTH